MDPIDAATAFLGGYDKDRGSMQNSTVQSETHTITGTATSDSVDGLVMVDLEGYTISEEDQQSLELPTTVDVHEGDTVQVTLVGGVGKSPIVTGVVGGGDRLSGNVDEALIAARAAEILAQALSYYFFHDSQGAHVATTEGNATVGPNALLDALALYFRDGLDVYAKFGRNGSQIGKDNEAHLMMDANSMELVDETGWLCFSAGDRRDLISGKADIYDTFYSDSTNYYKLSASVYSVNYVKVNSVETTNYTLTQDTTYPDVYYLSISSTWIPFSYIEISYKTTQRAPAFSLSGAATGVHSVAENLSWAYGKYSHSEGMASAKGWYSHAEGNQTEATGEASHSEGYESIAGYEASHAEGWQTNARAHAAHAEGHATRAGNSAHAEGYGSHADGDSSHAEGISTVATGYSSHAEGYGTNATSDCSHAEGNLTYATGQYSHAEGNGNTASGRNAHAEGAATAASGDRSHTEGSNTLASSNDQHVHGKYNVEDNSGIYAEIIGNGSSSARSNARTLDWDGNEELQGTIYLGGCTANGETPYSGIRYNTSTSQLEYYNGSSWQSIQAGGGAAIGDCHIYTGSIVKTVSGKEATLWNEATFKSTFNTTRPQLCGVMISNGDSGTGDTLGATGAEYWASGTYQGWHARWVNNLGSGGRRFNYIVAVPNQYSTV